MGRDHSPKERHRKQLERKRARRASYDRILIVCEGTKTEPQYFSDIRAHYRLHGANVVVAPSSLGTAPIQVVEYAKQLFEDGDRHKYIQLRAFEQVYAVFDRDDHLSYAAALRVAKSLDGRLRNDAKQPVKFKAIASVPCFELWLLLHFEDIQAPLHRNDVLQRLRRHIPGYEKGSGGIFSATRSLLPAAVGRAEALAVRFGPDTDPEPYTGIGDLVNVLVSLRE